MFEFSCFSPENVTDIYQRERETETETETEVWRKRERVVLGGVLANHNNSNFYLLSDSDTGMDQTAAADYDEQTEFFAFLTLCLIYSVLLLPFVLRSCFMTIISWGGERNALNENV